MLLLQEIVCVKKNETICTTKKLEKILLKRKSFRKLIMEI